MSLYFHFDNINNFSKTQTESPIRCNKFSILNSYGGERTLSGDNSKIIGNSLTKTSDNVIEVPYSLTTVFFNSSYCYLGNIYAPLLANGEHLTSDNTPYLLDNNNDRIDFTLASDNNYVFQYSGKTMSVTDCYLGDVHVYFTSPSTTYNVTLTKNLSNCSISPTDDVVTSDTTLTLTLSTGYEWQETPTITIDSVSHNFTVSDNTATFDLSSLSLSSDTTATINATGKETVTTYNITLTKNLSNCSISPTDDVVTSDTTLTLTLSTGYEWQETPTITIDSVSHDFTVSDNTATFDLSSLSLSSDTTATINATGKETVTPSTSVTVDTTELYNATLTSSTTFENGNQLYVSVKPNTGYFFVSYPTVVIARNGTTETHTTSETNGIYYYESAILYGVTSIKVIGNAISESTLQSNYATIHVYKVTQDILKAFSEQKYLLETASSGSLSPTYINLGDYIINIFAYPISLNTLGSTPIKCGGYTSTVDADLISTFEYRFIVETDIKGLYQNASDISHCDIKIYLPYHGYETIESIYINTHIKIEFIVNVISNECTVILYSNDVVINQYSIKNFSDTIPFTQSKASVTANNVASFNVYKNQLFVEVIQYAKNDDFYSNSKSVLIGDCNGYIQGDLSSELNIANATQKEINTIKDLLNRGVWI